MKLEGRHIAVVSNEPWGDIWYSKHNWAYELARKNKVFFIDPPARWRFANLFKRPVTLRKIAENLEVLSYCNLLPYSVKSRTVFHINEKRIARELRRFFAERGFSDFIFWSFDPLRLVNPGRLGASFSIFHYVDDYKRVDCDLCHHSNVFIVVSRDFEKKLCHYGKKLIYLPHGISQDEFSVTPEESGALALPDGDFGLYVGNLDPYRMDYALIEKMLQRFPGMPLVFVGRQFFRQDQETAVRVFSSGTYPNLISIPPVHFKLLKAYISRARFCFAPMLNSYTWNVINHHKILQYLALGKPVFSPVLTEYLPHADLLYMYRDHDHALNLLETFLASGEDLSLTDLRVQHARGFTFDQLIHRLETLLDDDTRGAADGQ